MDKNEEQMTDKQPTYSTDGTTSDEDDILDEMSSSDEEWGCFACLQGAVIIIFSAA